MIPSAVIAREVVRAPTQMRVGALQLLREAVVPTGGNKGRGLNFFNSWYQVGAVRSHHSCWLDRRSRDLYAAPARESSLQGAGMLF